MREKCTLLTPQRCRHVYTRAMTSYSEEAQTSAIPHHSLSDSPMLSESALIMMFSTSSVILALEIISYLGYRVFEIDERLNHAGQSFQPWVITLLATLTLASITLVMLILWWQVIRWKSSSHRHHYLLHPIHLIGKIALSFIMVIALIPLWGIGGASTYQTAQEYDLTHDSHDRLVYRHIDASGVCTLHYPSGLFLMKNQIFEKVSCHASH